MAFTGLGAGTVGDPYQITTWAQFKQIETNLSSHFKLMNDINAASDILNLELIFMGSLDGQNFSLINAKRLTALTGATIKNINITITPTGSAGYTLFNRVNNATIQNIKITNSVNQNYFLFGSLNNSSLTDLRAISAGRLFISSGNGHTTNTFNNCTFQSATILSLDWTLVTSDTYNDCKFIVTNLNRSNITGFEMRSCSFNNCLFYGHVDCSTYSTQAANKNYFTKTAIISNYNQTRTGAITYEQGIFNRNVKGVYNKCYFGGTININHVTFTHNSNAGYYLLWETTYSELYDCHLAFTFNPTFDASPSLFKHSIIPSINEVWNNTVCVRIFSESSCNNEFVIAGFSPVSGTNCYINTDHIEAGITLTGNYGQRTTAQTKAAANFAGFDFINVWQIQEGVTAPKLRNVIYSEAAYRLDAAINSISVARLSPGFERLSINTARSISPESLFVYISNTTTGLENPANRVSASEINSGLIQADMPANEGNFYVLVKFGDETYNTSGFHYSVDQVSEQTINVISPNYAILSNPNLNQVHGLIYHNGFIYGCARNPATVADASVFKIQASDYSVIVKKLIYLNKNTETNILPKLDQIVYCKGFLWCQSLGFLIRINPDDLDYMVFQINGLMVTYSQPIGTDGENLYFNNQFAIQKLNADLLLGSFASYGYTGADSVGLPAAILGTCTILQNYPARDVFSHSIAIDDNHIFVAATSTIEFNGYVPGFGSICHLQKIDKNTMQTVGDVAIPKCTDDMVQSFDYIFLAPELENTSEAYGADWGLLAVNKNTLEIKFLKALHQQFNTINETDRQTYGVQYYGEKVMVNMVTSKKVVIVNTQNINLWGENFPIGGATEAVLNFQINGVAISAATNEIVLDINENCHVTTWQSPATIFKFGFSETGLVFTSTPLVTTTLISGNQLNPTVGGNILVEGESPMTSGGFKYGTDPLNLINDLPADPFSYEFQEAITGLAPGIYYAKAYGTNTEGTFYGNVVMFSTYNAVELSYNNTIALLELLNAHYGCSIRCVQDAPGIATGTTGTATDQDGNVYDTVVINEKRWMVQNLKTTHFSNGDPIPNITDPALWAADEIGANCAWNNKPANV